MHMRPESCCRQHRRRCRRVLRSQSVRREPKLSRRMRHLPRNRTKNRSRTRNSAKNVKSMALHGRSTCDLRVVRKDSSQRDQCLVRREETSGLPGKCMNLRVRGSVFICLVVTKYNLHSSAIAEYHLTKDIRTPTRIFEKALETFSDEVDLVAHYLGFLLSINDENSELVIKYGYLSSPDTS